MRLFSACLFGLLAFIPFISVQADPMEEALARTFIKGYRQNDARLEAIAEELEHLPNPYLREPTGTGGFLTHAKNSSSSEVTLEFTLKEPVEIDAVALFPLRLFMDEIYADNLYWPGSITLEAEVNGQTNRVAHRSGNEPLIRQSLPELFQFEPVMTDKLTIRCTDLPQHPYEKWYAAGFAEICIFSASDNVAPRATCNVIRSRQGYHVLAKEFVTDSQTPLGVPELSSHPETHHFIKKIGFKQKVLPNPYILTCTYSRKFSIDAVRIDPAIQHAYGQSFPVRFTIELLSADGHVVQTDDTYKDFPLRNPGLNPHYSHFPATAARAVRFTILEASQPAPKAVAAIAFSEITPIFKGNPLPPAIIIEEQHLDARLRIAQGDPLDSEEKKMLASANDGLTHAGRVLSTRDWVEGLVSRQQLLEEQMLLRNARNASLVNVSNTLTYGSLTLLLLVMGSATYLFARNRIRLNKEVRATRVKIASDLHDDVGSNLGAIVLHIEKLQEQVDSPPEQKRLNSILRLTRESVFGLREVLSTSAPEVGRTQNIVAYMEELAALILGKTEYTFSVGPSIGDNLLDHRLRKGILLFYKEALYNAKRHSHCSRVEILLQSADNLITLSIQDNGVGIREETLKKKQTLRTLKQRAEWLQADLQITSDKEKGTQLKLSIPTLP